CRQSRNNVLPGRSDAHPPPVSSASSTSPPSRPEPHPAAENYRGTNRPLVCCSAHMAHSPALRSHITAYSPSAAVAQLVHQQVITNQQRVLHRGRRNLERLHDEGNHKHRNHYGPQ